MYIFLASDPLAMWGHIAAIILLIYLLVFILIGLALAFVLLVGMTWVREKVELIKMIRPTVNSVNKTTQAAIAGTLPEAKDDENKLIRTAAEIPAYAHEIETKVDQVSDRVAGAVIEFRARSMMAKSMLKRVRASCTTRIRTPYRSGRLPHRIGASRRPDRANTGPLGTYPCPS